MLREMSLHELIPKERHVAAWISWSESVICMAEVLARFTDPISTTDGVTYFAQACGAPNADGL